MYAYICDNDGVYTGQKIEAKGVLPPNAYVTDAAPPIVGADKRVRRGLRGGWVTIDAPVIPIFKWVTVFSFNEDVENPAFGIAIAVSDTEIEGAVKTSESVTLGDKWLGGTSFTSHDFGPELPLILTLYQSVLDQKFTEILEYLAGNPDQRKEQVWNQEVEWSKSVINDDDEAGINKDHLLSAATPDERTALPVEFMAAKVLIRHHGFKQMAALSTGGRRKIEKAIEVEDTYLGMIGVIQAELANEAQTLLDLKSDLQSFVDKWTSFYMGKAQALIAAQS